MPDYDGERFDPAAPVAEVTLRNPDSKQELRSVRMLIDTGADVTLIPRRSIEKIGSTPVAGVNCRLTSFDGTQSAVPAADVAMVFLGKVFQGRFLLIDSDVSFLGRDILNDFTLVFDGPRLHWSDPAKNH